MTICAMALGIVLGVLFAVMAMSPNPVLYGVAQFYIWFFRGTPLLLQLLLWFNLALIFPTLGIPGLFEVRTVDVITPFVATLLGPRHQPGRVHGRGRARRHPVGRRRVRPRPRRRSA